MKVWTDRQGKQVTAKEFMQRWKQGIQKVTPLQQTKAQLWSYSLIFIGIIIGLFVTFNSNTYWLFIILLGSFGISFIQFLGIFQKYLMLKNIERRLEVNEIIKTN